MIAITELISGQSFESINLTAQYFKLPMEHVRKALKSEEALIVDGRKYIFVRRELPMKGRTMTPKPIKVFPFGKYIGKKISQSTDLSYLEWLHSREDVNIRLKRVLMTRIKELKERVK